MEVKYLLFVFLVFSLCVSLSSSKRNHGSNTNQYQDQDDEITVVVKVKVPNHHHHHHENYVELDDIQDEKCNRCKGYTDIDSSSSSSSSIGSTMGSTGNEGSSSSDNSISSDKESIDKLDHQDYQRDICGCKFGYYGKLCRERELRYQQSFIEWSNQFNKTYAANEFFIRYELFKDNSRYVNQHNKKNDTTYQLGMNIFSDISPDEFLSTYLVKYNMTEIDEIFNNQTQTKEPTPTSTPTSTPNGSCYAEIEQMVTGNWTNGQVENFIQVQVRITNKGSLSINKFNFYFNNIGNGVEIWNVEKLINSTDVYGLPSWQSTIQVDQQFQFGYNNKTSTLIALEQVEYSCESQTNKPSNKLLAAAPRLPSLIDWRRNLPPVKNQGSCGSCYAFASIGSIEGQFSKKYSKIISLSEQEIVDCTVEYGNSGCNGGWMSGVYYYVMGNSGVQYGSDYRYTAQRGACVKGLSKTAPISGFVSVDNENDMNNALAVVGPVAIALQAGIRSFQMYSGGIYNDPICGSGSVDHAVLNVGYGNSDGINYYLIRNSWGTSWGEQGHMRIARNIRHVTNYGYYPII